MNCDFDYKYRQTSDMDVIPLVYKCIEYYFMSEIKASESIKVLNKIIALQNPTQSLYQMIMSCCLAIVAGHLPEYSNENWVKLAVLLLDFIETRDSFIYVQTLDVLLKGHSQKQKLMNKIEQIEMEQFGKSRDKIVTIDSGVTENDSVPVLLALYHKKKTVKKAALLSLYQQWIEDDNLVEGKDLRMIISMLVQFVEDQESEDIIIVTYALLKYLSTKESINEVLTDRLYKSLTTEFFTDHYVSSNQYSSDTFMKLVNLSLNLKVDPENDKYKFLIYLAWAHHQEYHNLLEECKFTQMIEDEQINIENVDIEYALELVKVLVINQELSNIASGVIWDYFDTYFRNILEKPSVDWFLYSESLISTLESLDEFPDNPKLIEILSKFIGKLPSLADDKNPKQERMKISGIIFKALNLSPLVILSLFETLCTKHFGPKTELEMVIFDNLIYMFR